jgi:uncharacterized protein (DUF2062 family)
MKNFLKKRLDKILAAESSAQKLALSTAVGFFIAFSPYLGIQTVLIFLISWALRLNTTVVFTITYLVNNPWTMIPIVVLDYVVGRWVAESLLGIDLLKYNPGWMASVNKWLDAKIGHYVRQYINVSDLSFWAYFIGGHIVALSIAFIIYPISKYFFKKLIERRKAQQA